MSYDRQARQKKLLGQILRDMKVVHEGQIQEALQVQKKEGGRIGQILIRLGHVTEAQLMLSLGRQAGLEVVDLSQFEPQPEAIGKVDEAIARPFQFVPVTFDGKSLVVAMGDPVNKGALDDIRFTANCDVQGVVADPDQVQAAIEKAYGKEEQVMSGILKEIEQEAAAPVGRRREGAGAGGITDLADAEEMANSAPVRKLLNYILYQAIRDRASDIHLEPFEDELKIRYRVDGVLYELEAPPLHLSTALISRVKVMSGLDISETRLPQDGRIDLAIGGRPVDLRVSTLPTMFGESCVMRVLDRSVVSLDLHQLGLRDDEVERVRGLLTLPHGIILVTGPTGSGKTTTLYSALNEANDIGVKIITTEDPVEYDLEGVIQVQINEEIGVTYSACLRSILRQDPDMILVGEIRDKDTAAISVEASLTGHVVYPGVGGRAAPGPAHLRRMQGGLRAVPGDPAGAGVVARAGRGAPLLLRPGLPGLQRLGVPGPGGAVRDHDDERRAAEHGGGGRLHLLDREARPRGGHADPAGGRPARHLRRDDQRRRGSARDDAAALGPRRGGPPGAGGAGPRGPGRRRRPGGGRRLPPSRKSLLRPPVAFLWLVLNDVGPPDPERRGVKAVRRDRKEHGWRPR
jgi:type IV pilus assembly protein PilB